MTKDTFTVGCIGCGNMGGAIMAGLAEQTAGTFLAYDPAPQCLEPLKAKGIQTTDDAAQLVASSDCIILAVKPWLVEKVLTEVQAHLSSKKLLISIAAGVSTITLTTASGGQCPIIRCMPNTPALVGRGVFAFSCEDARVKREDKDRIFSLFQHIGLCLELPEKDFTAFSALIGAGPAYVFHLMNALVQAGVTLGFPRAQSKELITALVAGCVRMTEQSPHNLTELRDNVCSPAGLTIAGVNHLERMGIGGHIVDAVLEANERGKEMEK